MKKVFEVLWNFFFWGNVYPLGDENSLPVFFGSILVAIAFVCKFYLQYAADFTVILAVCTLNTVFWAHERYGAEDVKHQKAYSIVHNALLGFAIVVACHVKFDLAAYVFGFIAILQISIWLAEKFSVTALIMRYGLNKRGVIQTICTLLGAIFEVISVISPAILIVIYIVLCVSLPFTTVAKVGLIVVYLIVIPIASHYQDDFGISVPEIILLKVADKLP